LALIKGGLESILVLLYPFVPHIASELWESLGHTESLDLVPWPSYSPPALEQQQIRIVVQVDGKVRGRIVVSADASEKAVEAEALADQKVRGFISGKPVRRVVQVPGRLVNIVLERQE
jgi:leucyl-tRNA synthetase